MSNVLKMAAVGGAAVETDPNFKQTVLLLHGDGTNGAQNNTFLDSSSNNFTITRNPATGPNAPTQGTFSPFSLAAGEWSNYFDGSDSLTVPTGTFSYTSGTAFTVEFFVYRTSTTGSTTHAQIVVGTSGNTISVYINNSGAVIYGQANVADIITSATGVIQLNKWHHVAIGKNSSNQVRMWVDGSSVGTGTDTTNYATGSMYVGRNAANTQNLDGYISNLRSVTGSDVYGYGNSSITVPTAPLTNITNTSLLTCQSNRFVDNGTANSGTGFAITRNGDVRVTPFSPFAPSAAYDPAVNGGSGYFDGTGDYLTVPDNAAFALPGDFTIEAWIYINVAATQTFFAVNVTNGAVLYISSDKIIFREAGVADRITSSLSAALNTWIYVAVARSGTTLSMWINGSRSDGGTTTNSTSYAQGQVFIGAGGGPSNLFTGYIANLRAVKGTAVYDPTSTTIPVPTAPPTAITNTSLLLNFTNAGIFDNTGKNNLETVGDAQIDTTTKKYGTGSIYIPSPLGQKLRAPASDGLIFGTGDFTIECWYYAISKPDVAPTIITNDETASFPTNYWALHDRHNSAANKFSFWAGNANSGAAFLVGTTNVANGTWYHVAVTRSGSTFRLFVNGTVEDTETSSASLDGNVLKAINIGRSGYSDSYMNGFIDDLRITKGVARYPTEPFPTKAFPDQ
jgi:hypothetical protein